MNKEIEELYSFLLTILPSSMSEGEVRYIAKQIIFAGYMKIEEGSVVISSNYEETLKAKVLWKIAGKIDDMINGVIDEELED